MITKLVTKSDKMFENFLDQNIKNHLINHFESTVSEIDIETELEILNHKHLETELNQAREYFIRHVNSCRIKNLDLINSCQALMRRKTLDSFCFFLNKDYYSKVPRLIGILVGTDFYLSKSQIDSIKANIGSKSLFKILDQKALLIDFVIQNLNENQCDYVQINQKMLFNANCVDFSNRKCEKISRNCFEQFDKIKYLNLSNNLFENISIFLNSNYLEELVLDNNNIKSISLGPNFRQLKKLNLANNNLKAIKNNTFDSLGNLNELDLSDNQLHSIDYEAFVSLENLNYLFLSNNCLDSVEFSLENCGNLYQIYLCSNKIKSIQPCRFQALKKLTVLNLSNNLIEELNDLMFNGLKSLEYLNLAENLIKSLDFLSLKDLNSLIELDFFRNRIEKVFNFNDLNSCTNLEFLNLSDNLIEELNVSQINSIKTLALTKNKIRKVKKIKMKNMEHLYLNKNFICKIELDTVDDYSNLKLLDLSENRLNAIQKSRWHDFSKSSVNNFQLII